KTTPCKVAWGSQHEARPPQGGRAFCDMRRFSGWKSGYGCSMLAASLGKKAVGHTQSEGRIHEAQRFSEGNRYWRRRCCNDGGARDRAVDAGDQVAADGELAEIARHAVGRGRVDVQTRWRSHRQQVPAPDLCRR